MNEDYSFVFNFIISAVLFIGGIIVCLEGIENICIFKSCIGWFIAMMGVMGFKDIYLKDK